MSTSNPVVRRTTPRGWLLPICLLAGASWAAPIPTAMARDLDSLGIGAMIGAGPVYDDAHGWAPNQIVGQTWYHYRPTVIGGVGLEFSSRNPSRLRAYTSNRYDLTATWIPHRTERHLVELSLIGDLTQRNGYIDTAARIPGAHAVSDMGLDWGLATRLGYGRRESRLLGWWVACAPGVAFRFTGSNAGVDYGLDGEAGLTISLQSIWYDSRTLTRSWDVFVRFPFRIESGAPDVSPTGARRVPDWRLGVQVGPTALF